MKKNNTILTVLLPTTLLLTAHSAVIAGGAHGGGHHAPNNQAQASHWLAPTQASAQKNPISADQESIAMGESIYQQYCSSCHGKNADGNGMAGMMLKPKPANLRVMAGSHPDGDFAYKIRQGRGAMPGWKNTLSETQVWHTVNYIQSLKSNSPVKASGHQQTKQSAHNDGGHGH